MEKPRAKEGLDLGPIQTSVPLLALLAEVITTAPVLGWLSAQALYIAEPVLQGFFSIQTLRRWAQVLEGDEDRK